MDVPVPGLHGAYLRAELVERLGRRWFVNALAKDELRSVSRFVVVESPRILDPWCRAAGGLLTAGPEAVISGVTAAMLHGCRSIESPAVHVLLPYKRQVRCRSGLVVHHGGFFADDVILLDGIRTLPLDRVTADLLCTAAPQDALALGDEVLRLAGDTFEVIRKQIGDRLRRRQDPRGTVRAAGLLDLLSPRAESPAESWMRMMLIERGFPIPEVNWPILGVDGLEIYRLDMAWPTLRIALEYNGYAAHAGREVEDEQRVEELRRRGWIVVTATSADLADPGRVRRDLRAAFARRGYTW